MNVRTSAVFTYKLLRYQKSNEWAQRTSAGLVDNAGPAEGCRGDGKHGVLESVENTGSVFVTTAHD